MMADELEAKLRESDLDQRRAHLALVASIEKRWGITPTCERCGQPVKREKQGKTVGRDRP